MVNQTQQLTEVFALIIETGSHEVRAGYAGEDTPKAVFSSNYGVVGDQMYFGEDAAVFRPGMEIRQAITAGKVNDWNAYQQLWQHAFNMLRIDPQEYPLIIVEPAEGDQEQRTKIADLAFDTFHVPALYFGRAPVLQSFMSGRHTAVIVDVGADLTTVTPVYEGFQLNKNIVSQEFAGNAINAIMLSALQEKGIQVTPKFQILKKKRVEVNKPADVTLKQLQGVTKSFLDNEVFKAVEDFKHCVGVVCEIPYNEGHMGLRPQTTYEFPDGYNCAFGLERYTYCEQLFVPEQDGFSSVAQMVVDAVGQCDQDIKQSLLNSVVVTGGGSLLSEFTERLQYELNSQFGRVKIFSHNTSAEKRFAAWIGGSILASLGTFQALWLTKQEYKDGGIAALDKRCP